MNLYSADEAGKILGITGTMVRVHCRNIGCRKVGNQYIIDDDIMEKLKARNGRGRPKSLCSK